MFGQTGTTGGFGSTGTTGFGAAAPKPSGFSFGGTRQVIFQMQSVSAKIPFHNVLDKLFFAVPLQ